MSYNILGKIAEDKVAEYLRQKGCYIAKRNYSSRYGEIDIIAENGELVLFVEVKARNVHAIVSPAEAVDFYKRKKIIKTALDYIQKSKCTLQPRFDVAQVTAYDKPDSTTGYRLSYLKSAFTTGDMNGFF